MKLSPDQKVVYSAVLDWLSDSFRDQILTLGGYAGSGKTTIVSQLAQDFGKRGKSVAYVAFTGRASSILARKIKEVGVKTTDKAYDDLLDQLHGDDRDRRKKAVSQFYSFDKHATFTGTIHRLLYRPIIDETTDELRGWKKREELDRPYDLIVCDEASMVSDDILHDISIKGMPLLAVGDHGQLPPVMAPGKLMQNPTLRLEKIHRQAEGNPIIALAAHVRNGGRLRDFKSPAGADPKAITFARRDDLSKVLAAAYEEAGGLGKGLLDVGLICWKNATRIALNTTARGLLGVRGAPRQGEIVVCLRNENEEGVFNGMRGILVNDAVVGKTDERPFADPWEVVADVEFPEEGIPPIQFSMCAPQFTRPTTFQTVEELREARVDVKKVGSAGSLFSFRYAMTCHKFQGSQADHVIVFLDRPEQPSDEDYRRWAYTAFTRASKRLTILT